MKDRQIGTPSILEVMKINYSDWNARLADYFFNKDNANKGVILYVNEETISKLYGAQEGSLADFISSVKGGDVQNSSYDICRKAYDLYESWKERRDGFPPYIAYLSFFVLAAGAKGDFAPHAYYPRYWELLGEPPVSRTPPYFDLMYSLWNDLQVWSIVDKREELGRFVVKPWIKWKHVGLPLSQTLCSRDELDRLPSLFEKAGLEASDLPSIENITRVIYASGEVVFQRRTIRILQDKSDAALTFRDALVNLVLEELEDWDGKVVREEEEGASLVSVTQFVFHICLRLNPGTVKSYLRFKATKGAILEELSFAREIDGELCYCEIDANRWSSPLKFESEDGNTLVPASELDWVSGERFFDKENSVVCKLNSGTTRLFRESFDNLMDWIEVNSVEKGVEYLIAGFGDDIKKIEAWGPASTDEFEERIAEGMPEGWRLFRCKNIRRSCQGIDCLELSSTVKLRLIGGIKSTGRSTYFAFALPKISIENGSGSEELTINGIKQGSPEEPLKWTIPNEVLTGLPIEADLIQGNEVVDRKTLYVEFYDKLPDLSRVPLRNSRGEMVFTSGAEARVRGVIVENLTSPIRYKPQLPFHLSNKIFFVGKVVGQIVDWSFPTPYPINDWSPVWAVYRMNKHLWIAHFCGKSEEKEFEVPSEDPKMDARLRKAWKRVVYNGRNITKEPETLVLRQLWRNYVEVGSHS